MNKDQMENDFITQRNEDFNNSYNMYKNNPANKAQALQLGKGFVPGEQGLLVGGANLNTEKLTMYPQNNVKIDKGDAIAFYNYQNDGSGRLNWRALHTGLPTTEKEGQKWIANHWFRFGTLV